jgi:hypothetical protein
MIAERSYYSPTRQDFINRFVKDGFRDLDYMFKETRRREKVITNGLSSTDTYVFVRAYISILGVIGAKSQCGGYKILENLTQRFSKSIGLTEDEIADAIKYGMEFEWLRDYLGQPIDVRDIIGASSEIRRHRNKVNN